MTDPHDDSDTCEECGDHCRGARAHALIAKIRAADLSNVELADHLHVSPSYLQSMTVSTMIWQMAGLTINELQSLSRLAGYPIDEAIDIVTSFGSTTTPPDDTARLIALLVHHAPDGCTVADAADHFGWTVRRVRQTARAVCDRPPSGCHVTLDQHGTMHIRAAPEALRPDQPLNPIPQEQALLVAENLFVLTTDQAAALWALHQGCDAASVPSETLAVLIKQGMVTSDAPLPSLSADLRYSLQWF